MQFWKWFSTPSTCKALAGFGIGGYIAGFLFDHLDVFGDIRQLSGLLLVAAIVRRCISPAIKQQSEVFADAYEQGTNNGWTLGFRQARPVVVPLIPQEPPAPECAGMCRGAHTAAS